MTQEGNTKALTHGGESAVKAIQKGSPLIGLAAAAEKEVAAELVNSGAYSMIEKNGNKANCVQPA
jgi:hypothetical protein